MERHDAAKTARRHLDAAERDSRLTVDQRLAAGGAYAHLAIAEELNRLALIIASRDGVDGFNNH